MAIVIAFGWVIPLVMGAMALLPATQDRVVEELHIVDVTGEQRGLVEGGPPMPRLSLSAPGSVEGVIFYAGNGSALELAGPGGSASAAAERLRSYVNLSRFSADGSPPEILSRLHLGTVSEDARSYLDLMDAVSVAPETHLGTGHLRGEFGVEADGEPFIVFRDLGEQATWSVSPGRR